MLGGWYYESIVFDIDSKGAMFNIVDQDESRTEGGAIRAHQAWVIKYAEVVYATHDAEPGTWDGVIECVTDTDDALERTGQARGFTDGIVVLST